MNFQRAPPSLPLISFKTSTLYAICVAWYVMPYVWCVICNVQGLFIVRSWLFDSRGDQKYPIWVVSGLFSDILKLTPGGSCIYTLSCKASYEGFPAINKLVSKRCEQIITPLFHFDHMLTRVPLSPYFIHGSESVKTLPHFFFGWASAERFVLKKFLILVCFETCHFCANLLVISKCDYIFACKE